MLSGLALGQAVKFRVGSFRICIGQVIRLIDLGACEMSIVFCGDAQFEWSGPHGLDLVYARSAVRFGNYRESSFAVRKEYAGAEIRRRKIHKRTRN